MVVMPLPGFVEWRYVPTGSTLHALSRTTFGHVSESKCGVWAPSWYGTGSQDEYERATTTLPPCKRCLHVLGIKKDS